MNGTVLGWLLALAAGADPLGETAKKELQALDGDWVLERLEARGKKLEADEDERMVLTIRGAKWSMSGFKGDKEVIKDELEVAALDPAADPKVIDFKAPDKRTKGSVEREGIYERDKDTLTLVVYQKTDKKRPTTFDTPTEPGTNLYVFKRAKP